MFGPLDFIYVPTTDVDADAQHHVDTLGAQLVWKVRGMAPPSPACASVSQGQQSCSPDTCTAPARSWCTASRTTPPRSASYASEA